MVDSLRQMAFRYYPLSVLVPPSTAIAAPLLVAAGLDDSILLNVEIQIPPGHSGLTGIALIYDGQQIFPWSNVPAWLTADAYINTFDVGMEVGSHLKAAAYNLDVNPHTFYLRFKVQSLPSGLSLATVAATTDVGTAVAPITSIIPPVTTPTEVPPVTITQPSITSVDPADPTIVALQQAIAALTQTVQTMQNTLDAQAQTILTMQADITTLKTATKTTTTGTATSTSPGANPAVVAALTAAATGGPPANVPITYTPGGALADPTTGRAVFTGPNGEGGLGAPAYAGQPSYVMPDGRTAYYYPGQYIQNGNRAALGLPPLPGS